MKTIKEVVIVEGKTDTATIQKLFDVQTIETHGLAIDDAVLDLIEQAQKSRGVIVLDKKLGIAEAREEARISALENLVTFSNDQETISWKEFISLDIIGDKARRLQIYDLFHLGYGNAKTLFKRLNLARITKQDILNKLGESK